MFFYIKINNKKYFYFFFEIINKRFYNNYNRIFKQYVFRIDIIKY